MYVCSSVREYVTVYIMEAFVFPARCGGFDVFTLTAGVVNAVKMMSDLRCGGGTVNRASQIVSGGPMGAVHCCVRLRMQHGRQADFCVCKPPSLFLNVFFFCVR